MTEHYNYTIIIPYRDKYDLLQKAVDSIPERKDIQIIIIDNSNIALAVDKVPRKQTATVLFLTSDPTMGAGRARNEGLKHVEGRWLLFLDADDYFTSNAFAAFDLYLQSEYDIIFFDADSIQLASGSRSNRHKTIHQLINTYIKTGNEDPLRYQFINPIGKMMKTDFVINNGIIFDEIPVSNDAWFSVMAGHAAKKITADVSIVYMITSGEKGSSLTQNRTRENWFTRFKVMVRINQFLKSTGKYKYRIRLLGGLRIAWREFGFKEFLHFFKYAHDNKVGIF